MRAREQGYLVIADISGYTSFLTSTELEHAHAILAELTELVIARLGGPIALPRRLSTFEFAEDGPGRSVVTMNVRDVGLLSRITIPLAALVIRPARTTRAGAGCRGRPPGVGTRGIIGDSMLCYRR